MNNTLNYRRGDILLADLGKPTGSVQGGCRPVVVIQNDIGNKHAPTLIVAPITSRTWKKSKQPTHYHLDKMDCLSESSMVLLEQITTIDKSRVKKFMGELDRAQMKKVYYCIEISLGLCEVVKVELTTEGKI